MSDNTPPPGSPEPQPPSGGAPPPPEPAQPAAAPPPEPAQPAPAPPPPPAQPAPAPPPAGTPNILPGQPTAPPPPPPPPPGAGAPPPGAMPPPPPAGAYAAPPAYGAAQAQYSVGDAFGYGWRKFQQFAGPLLISMLLYFLFLVVVGIIVFVVQGALNRAIVGTTTADFVIDPVTGQITSVGSSTGLGLGFLGVLIVNALVSFLFFLAGLIVQAGFTRGSLAIVRGEQVEVKSFFSVERMGTIIGAALLVAIVTSIGFFLCYLPGLIIAFFLQFFLFFLIDRNMGAIESIKASATFVSRNFGPLILFYLASLLAYFVGALLCGLGLIVAIPVVVVAMAYTYRKLSGETVAA